MRRASARAHPSARCDSGEDKNEQSVYVLTGVAIDAFAAPTAARRTFIAAVMLSRVASELPRRAPAVARVGGSVMPSAADVSPQ